MESIDGRGNLAEYLQLIVPDPYCLKISFHLDGEAFGCTVRWQPLELARTGCRLNTPGRMKP